MKKLMTIAIIVIAITTGTASATLVDVWNNSFETPATTGLGGPPASWNNAGCGVFNPDGWPDAGITAPAAHDGTQTLYMNASTNGTGAYIWQILKQAGTSDAVLMEANQTYTIKLWAGRINTDQGLYAPQLEVFIQDTTTWTQVGNTTQDLSSVVLGADMVELTYTIETGATPAGLGNQVLVNIRNIGTGSWQQRVTLDSVSVDVVPEPATMALLGLGGLLLRRKKR
jgi:hypothetical protein